MQHTEITPGLGAINLATLGLMALSASFKMIADLSPIFVYDVVYKLLALLCVLTSLIINYPKLKERIIKICAKWKSIKHKRRK